MPPPPEAVEKKKVAPLTDEARATMTPGRAFAAELVGTAILVLVIFCSTDERNGAGPQILTAATIGLTVTLIIWVVGLLRAVFRTVRDGRPFVPANATRLRWIAVAVIGGELARAGVATDMADRHAAARGLWRIATQAGLLH